MYGLRFGLGLIIGLALAVGILLGMGAINKALAQEPEGTTNDPVKVIDVTQVPERGYNYPITADDAQETILVVERVVMLTEEIQTVECRRNNRYLQALIDSINRHIEQDPDSAEVFEGALKEIEEAWCYDD